MKKSVVVTGAGGFVGANLVAALLREKYDVHAFVRKGGSLKRLEKFSSGIHLHTDMLSTQKKLQSFFKKVTPFAIFHLAAYGSYPTQLDLNQMIETNVVSTAILLESLKDVPYEHFIVAGSSSEYGKKDVPMVESSVLEPNNFYAATKAAQTHLCMAFAKTYNKPVSIFRLFNVFGFDEEKGRLVRSVIESALNHKPIQLATGKEARDFIFTADVADAFLSAIKTKPQYGEVFNIGTGRQTTIHELAQMVVRLVGYDVPMQLGVYAGRKWDSHFWKADMVKTYTTLGWSPKTSLEDGLQQTINWYKKQQ